jgi:hypothetical protein
VPPLAGFVGAGDAERAGDEDMPPEIVGTGDALGAAMVGVRRGEAAAEGPAAGVTTGWRCPAFGAARERRGELLADLAGVGADRRPAAGCLPALNGT